jgi:segregation and condensation protein B
MNKLKKDNIFNFPSNLSEDEREIEAIVFAAAEPLDIETIESKITKKINVSKVLEKLKLSYSQRGINLVCISNKWSFRTAQNLSNLMSQQKSIQKKLSQAAIETLSIIVYHQPVTRAEIEEIRGVAFGTNTLDILMELDWVKPQGRKNVPGKPIQYVTTDVFLSHFNLQKLSDLPTVEELSSAGLIDSSSVDSQIFGTGKFFKEKEEAKKDNIYSDIDEMLASTLDDKNKD